MNLLVSVPRLAGFSLITLIGAEVGDDTTSTASVRVLKAPMETLLPRRSPRSDDLERGDPGPPLHPITGTFADATHAKDFAARCFRLAFHLHAPLLAAFVVTDTYFLSVCTAPSITGFANLLVDGTLLLLRIGLHRSSDHSRAQQLGSAAWALYVVAFPLAARLDPGYMAGTPGMGPGAAIVFGFGLALLNSSHGLSFAHKTTLALVLLLTPPIVLALVLHPVAHFFNPVAAVTRATVRMTLSVTVYCWSFAAGHVCAHVMENGSLLACTSRTSSSKRATNAYTTTCKTRRALLTTDAESLVACSRLAALVRATCRRRQPPPALPARPPPAVLAESPSQHRTPKQQHHPPTTQPWPARCKVLVPHRHCCTKLLQRPLARPPPTTGPPSRPSRYSR